MSFEKCVIFAGVNRNGYIIEVLTNVSLIKVARISLCVEVGSTKMYTIRFNVVHIHITLAKMF